METIELIKQARTGDKVAREQVIKQNMPLVYSIVRRFAGRGHDLEDLGQIGSIGLIKAVDNFNLDYDVKFSTYAVPLITGEIKRFLRDDGMVKVSRTLKENGYRIRREAEVLAGRLGRDATLEELSAATELKKEDIVMALEAGNEVESLHKTVYQKEGSEISLMDRIPSERDESEAVLNRLMLDQLLTELEDRERRLIELRYFHDKTQMQVAELLEMNQVQVSRMEKKILRSMRQKFL
ncbi:MAG: SigB/SigF/SigG family RNA polymerase sigma factor [Eubacterium sp.]|jgi:RNA polymerase sigma factor, sigma-70 family/RNA polymerase sigma-70 factor, sigma-B/F/G subfamily|nr:SigB/SigF/SigG family RNA polymerase sigma factor [Eubacterium sp.]